MLVVWCFLHDLRLEAKFAKPPQQFKFTLINNIFSLHIQIPVQSFVLYSVPQNRLVSNEQMCLLGPWKYFGSLLYHCHMYVFCYKQRPLWLVKCWLHSSENSEGIVNHTLMVLFHSCDYSFHPYHQQDHSSHCPLREEAENRQYNNRTPTVVNGNLLCSYSMTIVIVQHGESTSLMIVTWSSLLKLFHVYSDCHTRILIGIFQVAFCLLQS